MSFPARWTPLSLLCHRGSLTLLTHASLFLVGVRDTAPGSAGLNSDTVLVTQESPGEVFGFSGSWASRYSWVAEEELRTEWVPEGLDLA